jgi:hypothetical protein
VLGQGAARLIVQTAGEAAVRITSDTSCGFGALLVKADPAMVVGGDGEQGSMTWHVDGCAVGASSQTNFDPDCQGGTDTIQGTLTVSATQKVTGKRQVILGIVNSITPNSSQSVTITFDKADMTDLAAWYLPGGGAAPPGKLTVHHGTLTGTVQPVTAERKSAPGTYDVATPIASFSNLSLTGAAVTLNADHKTFNLNIDSAQLTAMNGHYMGQGNFISGTISINGHLVTLPQMGLDPSYSQDKFDASYACTADMTAVLPP